MTASINLAWKTPGPISTAFMRAEADAILLNGPIGSAKTSTCGVKMLNFAAAQWPSRTRRMHNDRGELVPVRRFRACVIRDTYRNLWRSTLKTWWERVPQEAGKWAGAENGPCSHDIQFQLPDNTIVDFHADFVAIGDNAAEEVMRGYEPTLFYLNEMDMLKADVFTYASGRTGRFPPLEDGGPRWHGIIGDLNAPELHNWSYDEFFKSSPEDLAARGIKLFRQPSGLSPHAENRQNLIPDYYERQLRMNANKPWYINRMIKNIPGYSRDGKPVYLDEYSDDLHVKPGLVWFPHLPLQVGLDAGLNPAAIFGQQLPNGRWHVVAEFIGETGTGGMRFGKGLAVFIRQTFPGVRKITGYADPSAQHGNDKKAGEKSWIEIVAKETGIIIRPAPTNNLLPRLEAVRLPLTRLIDGQPGFLLSDACPKLRAGFNATYRFKRVRPGEESYHETPEKNEASHPHDALQYLCAGGGEHVAVHERHTVQRQALQQAQHIHDWNPLDQS
jgi:hypothetical protein